MACRMAAGSSPLARQPGFGAGRLAGELFPLWLVVGAIVTLNLTIAGM